MIARLLQMTESEKTVFTQAAYNNDGDDELDQDEMEVLLGVIGTKNIKNLKVSAYDTASAIGAVLTSEAEEQHYAWFCC